MARELRILNAHVERPDERHVREADRVGPSVAVAVQSADLKGQPVHMVRITEADALRLAEALLRSVRNLKGDPRQ